MRRKSIKIVLHYASKVLVLGVIALVILAPFSSLLSPSAALAQGILTDFKFCVSETEKDGDGRPKIVTPVDGECPPNSKNINAGANSDSCTTLTCYIANVVYVFTVGLGGAVAYVGAWVLSIAVALSLSSTAYALGFLSEGWRIVRDVANMFFILILVYIAFTIMFRADTAETMKRLAWVIAIALVINFSFFFVRVVIDAGNLLAIQFYNAIPGDSIQETAQTTGLEGGAVTYKNTGGASTKDLTTSIMAGVGVYSLLGNESFKAFNKAANPSGGWLGSWQELVGLSFIYIAVGAMFFILAATFFTVGIKFLIRIVVLWLVLIVAPLAFIAKTIKQGEPYYEQWQKTLITHAFYPAVFLFIFYILTLFMTELRGGPNSTQTIIGKAFENIGGLTSPETGLSYLVSMVAILAVYLGFVVILLYIGLRASEAMGVYGANLAQNVTGKLGGLARFGSGLPFRGALAGGAALGRGTLGKGALAASRSSAVQNLRPGLFGRAVRGTLGGLAGASYDARGIPGAGGILGAGGLLNVGKAGGKGGYAKQVEKRVKEIETAAKALKGDEVDIRNAQEKFEKNFDDGRGGKGRAAFSARVAELTRAKADALRDQKAAEARGNKAGADAAKGHLKEAENRIKELQEAGKKQVEELGKERIRAFAQRVGGRNLGNLYNPSRTSIVGAAKAIKITTEKSAKDKAAEAIKALQEEGVVEGAPTLPPTTAPKTRAAMDRTLNKGPLSESNAKLLEGINKLIKNNRNLQDRMEQLTEATVHGASSINTVLTTPPQNRSGFDPKVAKSIDRRLENIESDLADKGGQEQPPS